MNSYVSVFMSLLKGYPVESIKELYSLKSIVS